MSARHARKMCQRNVRATQCVCVCVCANARNIQLAADSASSFTSSSRFFSLTCVKQSRVASHKLLDMSRVPCVVRDVVNGAPQLRTTLLSSYPTPLVLTLAQRNHDQTRISACSQISGWATLGVAQICQSHVFHVNEPQFGKRTAQSCNIPLVSRSATSTEEGKSRTKTHNTCWR